MVKDSKVSRLHILIIAALVLVLTVGLGYLDKETRTIRDLFQVGNLLALFLYFLPAFALSLMFHIKLQPVLTGFYLWAASVMAGCVVGFLLAGFLLYFMLNLANPSL